MSRIAVLLALNSFLIPSAVRGDEAADVRLLTKAGVEAEGPALLEFLQSAVPREGGEEQILPLVKKMASEDFFEREAALKKVMALGPRAAPYLRQALKASDPELMRRAELCLKVIEGGPGLDVHGAALRLIGARKPTGAAAAILEYLPFAPNERLVEQAVSTLGEVALEKGRTAPALVEALEDMFAARRAAAAEVVARVDFENRREALLRLLEDDDVIVRLKAGRALALKHEKDAIPVLIKLLEELPANRASGVESMLQKLADYKGPLGPWATPQAMRQGWQKWWNVSAATVKMTKLTTIPKLLGKTLLLHANAGKVQQIDNKGKVEWEIGGLQFPMAAQMLDEGRVAILENRLRRVSIRNPMGGVVKTITVSIPTDLQALPGGNFLVTSRLALIEYDRDGKQVKRISVTGNQALSARKTPTGLIYCLTTKGQVLKLDGAGKQLAQFPVGGNVMSGGIDVTPEGRVLVTDSGAGRVIEFDESGKVRREWKVPGATSAVRLPNGNTLVACSGTEKVVEINERGLVVWEHATRGSPVLKASKR